MFKLRIVLAAWLISIPFCALAAFSEPLAASGNLLPAKINQSMRQPPCWEEAGISKSAMQQRRMIEQSAKSEIAAVCADPGLSQSQKQERIRQIHQQTRQKIEGLVTPAQQQAMKACQEARGGGHPGGGIHMGAGGGGGGPCGKLPVAAPGPPSIP